MFRFRLKNLPFRFSSENFCHISKNPKLSQGLNMSETAQLFEAQLKMGVGDSFAEIWSLVIRKKLEFKLPSVAQHDSYHWVTFSGLLIFNCSSTFMITCHICVTNVSLKKSGCAVRIFRQKLISVTFFKSVR